MIPTVDALEAYCGCGKFAEYSVAPYIATAPGFITESYLNNSTSHLERLQPNACLSFSTNGEIFSGERPTVTVQRTASEKTDDTPPKEEERSLAQERRRRKNTEAG